MPKERASDERLIAVIPLVADHLLQAVARGPHDLNLLGRLDQRLDARLRVAVIGVLHGHPDDRAGLEIDGMLGFVGQVRPPVFHLRDLRVGIMRMGPVSFDPFFFRFRSMRARSARVGVSMPDACASFVRKSW